MATFDQDQFLAALEPPVFVAGGRSHRGVILSAAEFFAFVERIAAAAPGPAAQLATIRAFFDLIFPPPSPPSWRTPRRRWRWWRQRRTPTVADHVATLPFTKQVEAFDLFWQPLAEQNGAPPRETTTPKKPRTESSPG